MLLRHLAADMAEPADAYRMKWVKKKIDWAASESPLKTTMCEASSLRAPKLGPQVSATLNKQASPRPNNAGPAHSTFPQEGWAGSLFEGGYPPRLIYKTGGGLSPGEV